MTPQVYRRLSLPTLLGLIGNSSTNLMIIGSNTSWIVNASTYHKRHFVGTKQVVGIRSNSGKKNIWQRLETFALRYINPGSTVKVYCLYGEGDPKNIIGYFSKKPETPFQAPGCSSPNTNGIQVPSSMINPIPKVDLDPQWLCRWDII